MIYKLTLSHNRSAHIATCDDVVVESTWSMKWAIDKDISDVISWVERHPGIFIEITDIKCRLVVEVAA